MKIIEVEGDIEVIKSFQINSINYFYLLKGNRGGGYRGYNNNNNGNGYQKSTQYQQVHSAPPS